MFLADGYGNRRVAVIDTRYWQYRPDGELWAPQAGQNKAFRELIGARFGRIRSVPVLPRGAHDGSGVDSQAGPPLFPHRVDQAADQCAHLLDAGGELLRVGVEEFVLLAGEPSPADDGLEHDLFAGLR